MTIAVAGLGVGFPGCEGVPALAARLRGGQSAGPLERLPGEGPRELLARTVDAVVSEAVLEARLPAARGPVLFVEPGAGCLSPTPSPTGDDVPARVPRRIPTRSGWHGEPTRVAGVAEALDAAREALSSGAAEAVLIVAASVREDPPDAPPEKFSIALGATGAELPPTEGAVALVLVDERRHPRGRARLNDVVRAEAGARGLAAALAAAPDGAGLLLVDGRRDALIAEATALGRAYRDGPRRTALASARAWLGDAGAAADLAGLAAAALCLERCVRPAIPGWEAPGPAALEGADGLAASDEPSFWHLDPEVRERRALVLLGGAVACLGAGPVRAPVSVTAFGLGRPAFLPLVAADRAGLEAGLDALEAGLDAGRDVADLAREAIARAAPDAPLRLALVAADPRELRRELGFMRRALDKAETGRPVRTPGGSSLVPRPIGPRGDVAFVYPGNGSAYGGLGRELMLAFAGSVAALEPEFDHRLRELMGLDHVLPPALARPDEAERAAVERRLNANMAVLPLVGAAFSILHTRLLRDVLGLRPRAALGYSIGECAMRAALGQWSDWRALERMLHDPVLLEGLSGEMTAVRRFWRERGKEPGEPPHERPWVAHYVRAGVEAVRPHLGPDAFVQSVLSPAETVLCGAPEACEDALARLGAPSLPLDFDIAVHAPPARAVRAELEALCDLPIEPVPGTVLWSAQGAAPVPRTREATARTLAAMLSEPIDFRALVERAYAAGVRTFVEVGVRSACTGWIGATLGEREHLAVALDNKGLPGDAAWMRAVAQLWAHRVPLDLSALSDGAPIPKTTKACA